MSEQFHDDGLISAARVEGTSVYNAEGEKLGSVDSIMIDKMSGEVAYVVMSFGGFLGIGEKYHILPWDTLEYDTGVDGYRVHLDRDQLSGGPSYARDELVDFDEERRDEIESYYGTARVDHEDTDGPRSNRSDRNDGIHRPLGYYSTAAQSVRNADVAPSDDDATHDLDPTDRAGFYSEEQQAARNAGTIVDEDSLREDRFRR